MNGPEFLDSVSSWPLWYWTSVLFGGIIILGCAVVQFPRATFQPLPRWPESRLNLAELTTWRKYQTSRLLYVLVLELVFVVISVLGPAPFVTAESLVKPPDLKAYLTSWTSVPVWAVVALVGAVPWLPFFRRLERHWRRWVQERLARQSAALVLSNYMKGLRQDFTNLKQVIARRDTAYARCLTRDDMDAPTDTTRHCWARLSAILWEFETLEHGETASGHRDDIEHFVDTAFVARHQDELDTLRDEYRAICESRAQDLEAGNDAMAAFGNREPNVETIFERTCVLLACAIITTHERKEDYDEALRRLGFTVTAVETMESAPGSSDGVDIVVQGVVVACGAVLCTTLLAPLLIDALPAFVARSRWPTGTSFAGAIQWASAFALVHGPALLTALGLRRYFLRRDAWHHGRAGALQSPHFAKLLFVSMASIVPASVLYAYFYWAVWGWGSLETLWATYQYTAPASAIGGVTAYFVIRAPRSGGNGSGQATRLRGSIGPSRHYRSYSRSNRSALLRSL